MCVPRDGGFAHVSCLAEQAALFAEAVENNLDLKVKNARWARWARSLCEQKYHGVVAFALGWALEGALGSAPERDQLGIWR